MTEARARSYYIAKTLFQSSLRSDAKTRGVKRCTPGNKKCGNRCIPVGWDCRLKGEGGDSHLRAVGKGSDPLAALANIQRGVKRIGKGIATANFSELQGGRQAIVRGIVKASPADIQKKKELQAKLIGVTTGVGLGLIGIAGGLKVHSILMQNPLYRDGPGRNIENSFRTVWNSALDTVNPNRRARTRAAAQTTRTAAFQRYSAVSNTAAVGELRRTETMLRRPPTPGVNNNTELLRSLKTVSPDNYSNVADWHRDSVRSFWTTPRTAEQARLLGRDAPAGYYMSTVASEKFLRRQYRISDPTISGGDLIDSIATQLQKQREALVAHAVDQGVSLKTTTARREFARGLLRNQNLPATAEAELVSQLSFLMSDRFNPRNAARDQYRSVNRNYDRLINDIVDVGTYPLYRPNKAKFTRRTVSGVQAENYGIATAAAEGHAEFLAQRLYGVAPRGRIVRGPATADLVVNHFYNSLRGFQTSPKAVARPWTASASLVTAAASEYARRPIKDPQEAIAILQSDGAFKGLTFTSRVETESTVARFRPANAGRTARKRSFKFNSPEEEASWQLLAKQFLDSGRYSTPEAAFAAARAEILKRRRNKT